MLEVSKYRKFKLNTKKMVPNFHINTSFAPLRCLLGWPRSIFFLFLFSGSLVCLFIVVGAGCCSRGTCVVSVLLLWVGWVVFWLG